MVSLLEGPTLLEPFGPDQNAPSYPTISALGGIYPFGTRYDCGVAPSVPITGASNSSLQAVIHLPRRRYVGAALLPIPSGFAYDYDVCLWTIDGTDKLASTGSVATGLSISAGNWMLMPFPSPVDIDDGDYLLGIAGQSAAEGLFGITINGVYDSAHHDMTSPQANDNIVSNNILAYPNPATGTPPANVNTQGNWVRNNGSDVPSSGFPLVRLY